MTAFSRSATFVIPQGASVSNGISFSATAQPLVLVGLRIPVMEATTTQIGLEVSFDPDSTADGDATWIPVSAAGFTPARVQAPTVASAASYVLFSGASDALTFNRVRLVATTDALLAVSQATAARTLIPVWATFST